jgi:integrase
LFYRADRNRWVARVTVDGVPHALSARTKTDARRQLDALRRAADDGLPLTPGQITLAELLELWAEKALPNRNVSPSRLAGHRWAMAILTEELGNLRLRNLTADQVEAAFARRSQECKPTLKRAGRGRVAGSPLSRSSLVKIRSTLNQALTWAQRRDLVARNIAPLVELPPSAAAPKPGKSLSFEQARQFLAATAGTELEAMWVIMLYLGLRPGEAAGLAWPDIDFDKGIIHVWRARKIEASGAATVGNTKTPGSIRSLDAPEVVMDALRRHRNRQELDTWAVDPEWSNKEMLVFTSPTGRPTDPKAVRTEFNYVIAVARIEGRWTPNLLRHTAASLMADAGMPIEQVADQLGHDDLRMLQKHYRHRVRPTVAGGTVLQAAIDGLS